MKSSKKARCTSKIYNPQKKVTRNGTLKSMQKPWTTEIVARSLPLQRVIIGKVVSMDVAPPTLIGASGPNHFASSGEASSVSISRIILASRATVPKAAPRYSDIKMLDRE